MNEDSNFESLLDINNLSSLNGMISNILLWRGVLQSWCQAWTWSFLLIYKIFFKNFGLQWRKTFLLSKKIISVVICKYLIFVWLSCVIILTVCTVFMPLFLYRLMCLWYVSSWCLFVCIKYYPSRTIQPILTLRISYH